jgi:hypothetical protein
MTPITRRFFAGARNFADGPVRGIHARGARGCNHAPSFGRALSPAVHVPASGWAQQGLLHNAKLRKLVADLSLDKDMLQDVIRRKL